MKNAISNELRLTGRGSDTQAEGSLNDCLDFSVDACLGLIKHRDTKQETNDFL